MSNEFGLCYTFAEEHIRFLPQRNPIYIRWRVVLWDELF